MRREKKSSEKKRAKIWCGEGAFSQICSQGFGIKERVEWSPLERQRGSKIRPHCTEKR